MANMPKITDEILDIIFKDPEVEDELDG